MPEVPVNYLAVLAAAVAAMAAGFLWYGPFFGRAWMALSGRTQEDSGKEKTKDGMGRRYVLAFIGSLIMAYVLAHSLVFAGAYLSLSGMPAGLMAGFWSWLGFVAPVTLSRVLWDGQPFKLWLLDAGYYLATLLLMGALLGVWA